MNQLKSYVVVFGVILGAATADSMFTLETPEMDSQLNSTDAHVSDHQSDHPSNNTSNSDRCTLSAWPATSPKRSV